MIKAQAQEQALEIIELDQKEQALANAILNNIEFKDEEEILLNDFLSENDFKIKDIFIRNNGDMFLSGRNAKDERVIYYDYETCLWKYGMISLFYTKINKVLNDQINNVIRKVTEDNTEEGAKLLKRLAKVKKDINKLAFTKKIYEASEAELLNHDILKNINKTSNLLPIKKCSCIDFNDLKIIRRTQYHYFTFEVNVELTEEELKDNKTNKVTKFINEIMSNDKEMAEFLQIISGYMVTGEMDMRSIFIYLGKGSNGKSLYERLMWKALGEGILSKEGDKRILVKHTNKATHSEYLASLEDSRLVVVGETDEGEQLNEALIKKITGQDRINVERKGDKQKEICPNSKLLCLTNRKLHFDSSQQSLIDRFIYVPFKARFVDNPNPKNNEFQKDRHLEGKLSGEYFYQFMIWLSHGAHKYYKLKKQNKPVPFPKVVKDETIQYLNDINSVKSFIDNNYTKIEYNKDTKKKDIPKINLSDLYKEYKKYYDNEIQNGKPDDAQAFKQKLSDMNFNIEKYGSLFVWGIKSNNDNIIDEDN